MFGDPLWLSAKVGDKWKKDLKMPSYDHRIHLGRQDTQHKELICDTQHNNALPLCWVSRFIYYYAECCVLFTVMLNIVMPFVIAPHPGMVDFEKIVNTEIEIYRIEFFLISKSVFTESVFEICNFDFNFKSIISKFFDSIWNWFLHYKSIWKWDYRTLIHQQCPNQIDLKPIQNRNKLDFYL